MVSLRDAQAWLYDQRLAADGRAITYQRGNDSAEMTAIPGRTAADIADRRSGHSLRVEFRDFVFRAADLVLDGVAEFPEPGDKIVEEDPDTEQTHTLRVLPVQNGEACWRFADETRRFIRVHCKQIEVEATT